VLDDPAFRKRYADAWRDAQRCWSGGRRPAAHGAGAVRPVAPGRRPGLGHPARAGAPAHGGASRRSKRRWRRCPAWASAWPTKCKQEVERRNGALLAELDQRRAVLKAQVIASILLAALLAGGFGLWLSRPLEQIEQAIDTLGENRYDQPIAVRGPSDLQRVGQQLNWLRQRLAELEADKARFLRHISHELKTPLAALREGVALLEDGVAGALSPKQREIAGILNQNTGRCNRRSRRCCATTPPPSTPSTCSAAAPIRPACWPTPSTASACNGRQPA
jgi:two-component system sensor histidine kinase GlrK